MVATRESAALAESLLAETIAAEGVPAAQLTIHSDNGTSMASKTVALLLADLGVVKSHTAPREQRQPLQRSAAPTVTYPCSRPVPLREQTLLRRGNCRQRNGGHQ